jgi:Cytidylate kinase-like family
MALLLISRGSFSGGQLISQCLSKTAGMQCLTREDLIAGVNTHGELANKVIASMAKGAHDYSQLSALRRPYKILMQLALLERVRQGNVAYFGYSGHLLLPGIPHAVRVRVIAPAEMRVRLLMGREKLTPEEASERIRQVDAERARWTRFMYGKNLRDPELFDLCLNLERISFPTACCILVNMVQQSEFKATPESLALVEARYLSARVLAALLEDSQTFELEVGATVEDGCVTLEGPYLDDPDRSTVLEIARAVPGVTEVQYKEGYAPPFDMTF